MSVKRIRSGKTSHPLVDVTCEVRHDTGPDGALLLFDGSREAWVPHSLCQDNGDGTVTMPVWKAKEVGFV